MKICNKLLQILFSQCFKQSLFYHFQINTFQIVCDQINTSQQYIENIKNIKNDNSFKKIHNQLKDIQQNPPTNWRVVPDGDYKWVVWMEVQSIAPFYGDPIKLQINFSPQYPIKKALITICQPNKFFHANIGFSGSICHADLKSDKIMGIRQSIQCIISLLSHPRYDDYLNAQAAKLYKENQKQWYRKALRIFRGYENKSG